VDLLVGRQTYQDTDRIAAMGKDFGLVAFENEAYGSVCREFARRSEDYVRSSIQ